MDYYYFEELDNENYFDYDNGKAIICHNKKGDFISIKFIEDTLNNMLKKRKKRKKILESIDEYHTVAILTIDSEIRQLKEIKKILLGAKNYESNK